MLDSWLYAFINNVFKNENLENWSFVILSFDDGDNCYPDLKKIEMSNNFLSDPWYYQKLRFLHEVSHAIVEKDSSRSSLTSHDKDFFTTYGQLLIKYSDS